MNLKYYNVANKYRQPNPKASYYADYNAIADFSFDNAPNVIYNEIEYETEYGTNQFETINRVRVDTVLEYNTGIILGDDYKTLIFAPEFDVTPYYGMKFRWMNNYWLVINTNSYGSMINSAEIRRCNNVLRFFNDKGERISEPCIMDYTLRFANNEDTKTIVVGNGEQKVWCQRNSRTSLIKANDRFLFGTPEQRVSFRLYGGGTKNYMNSNTEDDNSPTITEFYTDHYEINPLFDDLVNGYADAYLNEVTIKIQEPLDFINVGQRDVLEAKVYRGNEELSNADIVWTSSDESVIAINDNIAEGISVGGAIITATIKDTNISDSYSLNIVDEPIYNKQEIVVEPNINYVLQGKSQQFSVYFYVNGIRQDDSIAFVNLTDNVPDNKYEIIVDDNNHFTLINKGMYMDYPVLIKCSCNDINNIIRIELRGLY